MTNAALPGGDATPLDLSAYRAYDMKAVCGNCGSPYGRHVGLRCQDKVGTFVLVDEVADLKAQLTLARQQVMALQQELELEKSAHQYTIDMERVCGRLLVDMNKVVVVPEGSSLFAEVKRLSARAEAAEQQLAALKESKP